MSSRPNSKVPGLCLRLVLTPFGSKLCADTFLLFLYRGFLGPYKHIIGLSILGKPKLQMLLIGLLSRVNLRQIISLISNNNDKQQKQKISKLNQSIDFCKM